MAQKHNNTPTASGPVWSEIGGAVSNLIFGSGVLYDPINALAIMTRVCSLGGNTVSIPEEVCALEYESVRRTPRYFLVADIEVTDVKLEIQIRARTKTLSMCGCGADTSMVFPKGTSVRVKLSHRGAEVTALGRVVYSGSELGMGVAFTSVEREDERILECWIEESLSTAIREQ